MAEDKLTFAAIVLVAIVAIVGMIGLMGTGGFKVTGAGTTGTLNVTITGTVSITLTDAASTLCSGYVWSNSSQATLNTEGTATNWSCGQSSDPMAVQNNGTTKANVTIKAGSAAAAFINGTNPIQQYKGPETGGNNCSGTGVTSYTNLTTGETNLCSTLEYSTSGGLGNTLAVNYQLVIPNNAPYGSRTNTITFTGYQA